MDRVECENIGGWIKTIAVDVVYQLSCWFEYGAYFFIVVLNVYI